MLHLTRDLDQHPVGVAHVGYSLSPQLDLWSGYLRCACVDCGLESSLHVLGDQRDLDARGKFSRVVLPEPIQEVGLSKILGRECQRRLPRLRLGIPTALVDEPPLEAECGS